MESFIKAAVSARRAALDKNQHPRLDAVSKVISAYQKRYVDKKQTLTRARMLERRATMLQELEAALEVPRAERDIAKASAAHAARMERLSGFASFLSAGCSWLDFFDGNGHSFSNNPGNFSGWFSNQSNVNTNGAQNPNDVHLAFEMSDTNPYGSTTKPSILQALGTFVLGTPNQSGTYTITGWLPHDSSPNPSHWSVTLLAGVPDPGDGTNDAIFARWGVSAVMNVYQAENNDWVPRGAINFPALVPDTYQGWDDHQTPNVWPGTLAEPIASAQMYLAAGQQTNVDLWITFAHGISDNDAWGGQVDNPNDLGRGTIHYSVLIENPGVVAAM